MAQYRKLTNERLADDQIIVAYHPKKENLLTNGEKGVICKVIKRVNKAYKVQVLGTTKEVILNLDDEGAWAYDPSSADTDVVVNVVDFDAWPKFTARMQREGWQGKVFKFDVAELHVDMQERSPGFGLTLLRHRGETVDPDTGAPYTNNFLMSSIFPVNPPEWRVPRAERMGIGAVELPLPPKPVSAEHQEVIDKITPVLSTLNKEHCTNVSFAKFGKGLKQKRLYQGQVCHRAMQEDSGFPVQYIATIGVNRSERHNGWVKGLPGDEAMRFYITYLTNYSPYADAFLTKDPDYIMEHGYVLTADAPKRIVVGACYATRQIWERPQRAEGFLALYKAGIPLDAAFVFGCQTSEYKNGKMKMTEAGGSHSHLNNYQISDECILNFIDHTPQHPGKPYKEDCYASRDVSVDAMWSSKFNSGQSDISKKLASIKGAGQWGNAITIDDCVEQAADYIDDWLAKMGV